MHKRGGAGVKHLHKYVADDGNTQEDYFLQDGHAKLLKARDEDLKALDVEEIDIARQAVSTLHPLAGLRAEKVLPNLLCCFKWCRIKTINDLNDSQTYELGEDE